MGDELSVGEVTTGGDPPRSHVEVAGELDHFTAVQLERSLTGWLRPGGRDIDVDMRRVRFLDAGGLAALTRLTRRAQQFRLHLRLFVAHPRVLKVLRITGLHRVLDVRRVDPPSAARD